MSIAHVMSAEMAWQNYGSDKVGETGARFGGFPKNSSGQVRAWAVTNRGRDPECGERLRIKAHADVGVDESGDERSP
jgi:hypothetical protein